MGRSIKFPFLPPRKGTIDTFVSWARTGCDAGGRSALLLLGGAEQTARGGFTTDNLRLTLMNSILYELCFLIVL